LQLDGRWILRVRWMLSNVFNNLALKSNGQTAHFGRFTAKERVLFLSSRAAHATAPMPHKW